MGGGFGHLTRTLHLLQEVRAREPECSTLLLCPRRAESVAQEHTPYASTDDIGRENLSRWVRSQVQAYQPDLMVIDTFPRGVLGELVLPTSLPKVLVTRWVKPGYYSDPGVARSLQQFQSICWTEPKPSPNLPGQTFSPVMGPERPATREVARATLKADDRPLVLGVGSGPLAEQKSLSHLLKQLCQSNNWNFRWFSREMNCPAPRLAQLLPGADLVVTAAGYNTYYELLRVGVPAILLPQARRVDDQFKRASGALGYPLQAPHEVAPPDLESAARKLIKTGPVRGRETFGREQVADILLKVPAH